MIRLRLPQLVYSKDFSKEIPPCRRPWKCKEHYFFNTFAVKFTSYEDTGQWYIQLRNMHKVRK